MGMAFGICCGIVLLLAAQGLLAQASLGKQMRRAGLVDIQRLDHTLRVELKYSMTDNFMHADVYGDLEACYLQRDIARKLVKAQALLKKRHPGLFLKVFDGARPRRVQVIMWNIVKGTDQQKYVTSPAKGSIHNYGSAVDLTITDVQGNDLDMGTPYDFLGELAQPRYEERFLAAGKLTKEQIEHRALLRNTMISAGFSPIPNEWWHFDGLPRSVVTQRYKIIE